MISANCAQIVGLLVLIGPLVLGHATLPVIIVSMVVVSAAGVAFGPAEHLALTHMVPDGRFAEAMALDGVSSSASNLIGPPIGGTLFQLGRFVPFLSDAGTYLMSIFGLLSVRKLDKPATLPQDVEWGGGLKALLAESVAGLRAIARDRLLSLLLFGVGAINVAAYALDLGVIIIARHGGAPAVAVGIMLGMAGAGGVGGGLVAKVIVTRVSPGYLVAMSLWAWTGCAALLFSTREVYAMGVILAVAGLVTPPAAALLRSQVIVGSAPELRGRTAAGASLILQGGSPLGYLLSGTALGYAGRGVFLGSVVAIGVAGCAVVTGARRVREWRAVGQPEPEVPAEEEGR